MVVAALMWFDSYDSAGFGDTLTTFLGVGLLAAAWAGVWSIASRVAVQRFNYLSHLAVFSAVLILVMGLGAITSWALFLIPSLALATILGVLAGGMALTVLIAAHLSLCPRETPTLVDSRRDQCCDSRHWYGDHADECERIFGRATLHERAETAESAPDPGHHRG